MNRPRVFVRMILALAAALGGGCTGIPDHIKAVQPFDAQRYVGTWYEIARLPNNFEKGLEMTVDWYLENEEWMKSVTSGAYQGYYEQLYGNK